MNGEIEEIEAVKQTDSQKSVATSIMYSMDFTDSGSDKNNSSGMETYVLEWDSESSESPRNKNVNIIKSTPVSPVSVDKNKQCTHLYVNTRTSKRSSNSDSTRSIVAREIYTQTSKTIIQLAENAGVMMKSFDCNTLETQTSFLSIGEKTRVEYTIQMTGKTINKSDGNHSLLQVDSINNISFGGDSSKLCQDSKSSSVNLDINDKSSEETIIGKEDYECQSDFELTSDSTDIDEDSLVETSKKKVNTDYVPDTPKSVSNDVAELYSKLYEGIEFQCTRPLEKDKKPIGHLSPLVEETVTTTTKLENLAEGQESPDNVNSLNDDDKDVLFTNNAGIKVKLFPEEHSHEAFKLPLIQKQNSSHTNNLDFLFGLNHNKFQQSSESNEIDEPKEEKILGKWELSVRDLGSGESPLVSGRSEAQCGVQLPPIHLEGCGASNLSKREHIMHESLTPAMSPISINKEIKELKLSYKNKNTISSNRSSFPAFDVRTDAAERSCDLLCSEIFKRLRSPSWFEVINTLIDIPSVFDKFWKFIPEFRTADLLRLVTSHVESPRSQVARTACQTLSIIIMNTNYTKKPDFYEAVTMLLIKTGSFSRPVRHAANVALDNVVCTVQLSDVISVLCIHGVTHKSPLVRSATARLLVVCCALRGGGRALLRARPPSAASARRLALRSLAQLLDDKSTDTRKYAVRLYSMLRPLSNFEAYYLTDVNVELATTQIKKFDRLLLCSMPETR